MTPEGKVKKQVKDLLDKTPGCWYFMPATYGYGRSGTPDIIGCHCERFFAIECKANGNKPTALQEAAMEKIRVAGGIAVVVDGTSINKFKDWWEQWTKLAG